ncbi:serine protease inhibitor-like SPI-1 [Cotia virus SPAn232]|uniref:Serine protease inhibitor-like SPI-1 n=2 Tax=Cotia virus TaxID=39444 RepID=H6TAD5_9POXV|nr:serine protease inhibitor-like SPI-1 [Cotia virus SPAn232]AFB76969.1 serine protease inhibitor-like SPI-1 [Cotia virus SPAn232]AIT70782.1 serine protease inhibitor-like SPI-1 [Cotia virus]
MMDIFREIALEKINDNIIFSPESILSIFSLLKHGAANNTADEILNYIINNYNDNKNDSMEVDICNCAELVSVNKIYCSNSIEFYDDFIQKISDSFQTVNFNNTFETMYLINEYVKSVTNGKINYILDTPLPFDTKVTVINCVYFKAKWKYPFLKNRTYLDKFYVSNKLSTNIDMMVNVNNSFLYGKVNEIFGSFSIIDIPYEGESSMVILLPDNIDGIYSIEKNISIENFKTWYSLLSIKKIDVYIPKFKVEITEPYNLVDILYNIGLCNIFGTDSDFSNMCKDKIFIEKFLQKSYIDVSEEYTEATSCSFTSFTNFSLNVTYKFYANHPFIYIIKDNKNNILFIGRYLNP